MVPQSKIGRKNIETPYNSKYNMHVLGPGKLATEEWEAKNLSFPDMDKVSEYRIKRVHDELRKRDYAGALLYDPLNIRYLTNSTNMQIWTTRNFSRYCYLVTDGPLILFEYLDCEHLTSHSKNVDEIRRVQAWIYFSSGEEFERDVKAWGVELAELIKKYGGEKARIAVDKLNPEGVAELAKYGITTGNGEQLMENARLIKCEEEIKAMKCAIAACEKSMEIMAKQLVPGVMENEMWGELQKQSFMRGGEWVETRLLASGPRTNPWYQESSSRIVELGDIFAFDTDLVGSYGICVDISRTWVVGKKPTDEQQRIYDMARDQVEENISILKPGMSFRDFVYSAKTYSKDEYYRYGALLHGVGLCDEYPFLVFPDQWEEYGNDGVFQPGMVVCVESYVGAKGGEVGKEGAKIEEQILITETGYERLTSALIELDSLSN